jgi:MFS family permease
MYEGTPIQAPNIAEDWMAVVFVLTLIGIAWLRHNDPRRIQRLFLSIFNVRLLRQVLREEIAFSNSTSFVLSTIALFGISLFLYVGKMVLGVEAIEGSGLLLFGKISLLVFIVYLIKFLGIRAIQILGDGDFGLSEYVFNVFLFNQIAGLVLMPVMAIAVYVSLPFALIVTAAGAVVLSSFILIRIGRGLSNAMRLHVRPFYIVLYLCALEFLPLALLIKVILP